VRRLASLAGVAAGVGVMMLTIPPFGFWPLGWFCLAPFFVCLNASRTRWEALAAGYVGGCCFSAGAYFWAYGTCRYAHFSVPVSLFSLSSVSLALGLNWALAGLLGARPAARLPRILRPWLWASVFTAVTYASEHWTQRVPGDMLGYTQWPNLALIQAGSWGGPHLLGFAVLLFNAALAEAWADASGPAAANVALATALAAGLWVHGEAVLLGRPADPGPTARVEVLQPDIKQFQKWDLSYAQYILDTFDELQSRPLTRPPALVVWPETAIPRKVPREHPVAEAAVWARRLNAAQLVGIVAQPDPGEGAANAAQLVEPDGRVSGL